MVKANYSTCEVVECDRVRKANIGLCASKERVIVSTNIDFDNLSKKEEEDKINNTS